MKVNKKLLKLLEPNMTRITDSKNRMMASELQGCGKIPFDKLGRTGPRQEKVMITLQGKGRVPIDMLGRTRPRQGMVVIMAEMA